MTFFSKRRMRTSVIAGLAGVALTCTALPATAVPQAQLDALDTLPAVESSGVQVDPRLADASGTQTVFVQFKGEGAAEVAQSTGEGSSAVNATLQQISETASSVEGELRSNDGAATTLYTMKNTVPGTLMQGDAAAIRELSNRSDIVSISKVEEVERPEPSSNGSTDVDTRALAAWTQTKYTGKGVKIAVVDSGLDYTHTDFGGTGTKADYDRAKSSPTMIPGTFDPKKVLPGVDLAGDAYNAKVAGSKPQPDENPLDCVTGGHGTHVAGTAVGYGVKEDGTTYRAGEQGDPAYSGLTAEQVLGMKIGPGSAPEAQIIPIRVFGCEGSTSLTIAGIDRAMDPNQDGKFDDRADIINLSLGSDLSPYEVANTLVMNRIAKLGVLPVVASGNAGDATDIGGSPGNADGTLTVANSVGTRIGLDKIKIAAPAGVADADGTLPGQYSGDYLFANGPVTLDVVAGPTGANAEGCLDFSADDKARVAGKAVWLKWNDDDATRGCGSAVRFNKAAEAGAAGVILDSERNVFGAGIAGNAKIPGFQFRKEQADKLRPALAAGTLKVTYDDTLKGLSAVPSGAGDTLSASSSRGIHGSHGVIKPEVAAPGASINSAGVGSGTGSSTKSGTSMATPHVAGIAALVKQEHPELKAQQLKAIVTNTATHAVKDANGNEYGPTRVGSGRVDALDATSTSVFAYNTENPALVSLSFGVVETGADVVMMKKQVTLSNIGTKNETYSTSVALSTELAGVGFTVSPASVTVPAGKTATVDVQVSIDPTKLDRKLDATMSKTQALSAAVQKARQYVTQTEGRIVFTQGAQRLFVPLHVAPKPTSDVKVNGDQPIVMADGVNEAVVPIAGRALSQGQYLGLGQAFELVAESPKKVNDDKNRDIYIGSLADEVDLEYVGVRSDIAAKKAAGQDAKGSTISFAIATYGNRAVPNPGQDLEVLVSTKGDDAPEYAIYATQVTKTDLSVVQVVDLATNKGYTLPLNGAYGDLDTNAYDNNVWVYSLTAEMLGLDPNAASLPITMQVVGGHSYNSKYDVTAPIKYDLAKPKVWAEQGGKTPVLYADGGQGTDLTVHRAAGVDRVKALFVHLHNATGDLTVSGGGERTQVLQVGAVPTLKADKAEVKPGDRVTLTAEKFTPGAEVAFVLHSDPVELGKAVADAKGTAVLEAAIPANTPVGAHEFVATNSALATERAATPVTVAADATTPPTGEPTPGPTGEPTVDPTVVPVPTGTDEPTPGPGLPGTGAEGTALTLLGALALLLAGGAALALRRRGAGE